jgi:hypothetical protein
MPGKLDYEDNPVRAIDVFVDIADLEFNGVEPR